MSLEGERTPESATSEIVGINGEAAELAKHIKDTQPAQTREKQLELLIELLDDANELALAAHLELKNE